MDRVVCGDVGFGKIEMAMRAAFLPASAGRQVAMLALATLLTQQHYQNFLIAPALQRRRGEPAALPRRVRQGYVAEAKPVIDDLREAIASRRRAAERELPRAAEGHFVIDLRQRGR